MMRTLHWFLFRGRRAADGKVTQMMPVHAVDSEKNLQAPWAFFSLCPFSQIAIRVMKLVNNEDTPFTQVSSLISSDPAFSSEVLRIANSLWYAPRVPAVSIAQAVARLGTKNLQGIALTVAMRSFLGDAMSRPVMRDMWRHNLACGLIAEILAPQTDLDKDLAFTGAVLHDLGRLALAVLEPKEYVFLLAKHKGPSSSILLLEREAFGYDHCEVGAELVASWKLPVAFESIVAHHHCLREKSDPWDMAALVNVSCRLADSMGFPSFHGVEVTPYAELLEELPTIERGDPYPDMESLGTEVRTKMEGVESI
jgi:putative nucleotidyltransferase with HDIG domain